MVERSLFDRVIINVLLFLCFFIYIKKVPLDVETQPLIIFFVSILYVLFLKIQVKKYDVLLILHLVLLTLYFTLQLLFYGGNPISGYISYLVGPFVYFVFLNKFHLVSFKLVKGIIVLFGIYSFIVFFRVKYLYDFLEFLSTILIARGGGIAANQFRGISIFTPEPSYFAFSSILLLVLVDLCMLKNKNRKLVYFKILVVIISFLTKSALVYLYIALYFIGFYINPIKRYLSSLSFRRIMVIVSAIFLMIIPLFMMEKSRPAQIVNKIMEYKDDTNFFDKIMIYEPSGSTRPIMNYLAFRSLSYRPLGWGIGEFENNFHVPGRELNHILTRHEVLRDSYISQGSFKAQTYLTNLIGDIGYCSIFMALFLFITFIKTNLSNSIKFGILFVIPFMLIFYQGQISNPIIWVLLAYLNSVSIDEC